MSSVVWGDVTSIVTFPGGSNGSVQFNKSGRFEGDFSLTYSSSTKVLSVPGVSLSTLTARGISYTFPATQTGGSFLQVDGNGGLSWATPSTFSVSSGTTLGVFDGNVQITSPTAALNFNGGQFIVTLQGATTAAIAVDPSSVTLLGPSISLSNEVTGSLPAASIAAGSLGSSVIASSIAVNSVLDGSIVSVSGSKVTGDIPGNSAGITGTVNVDQVIGAVSVYPATATAMFPFGFTVSTIAATSFIATQTSVSVQGVGGFRSNYTAAFPLGLTASTGVVTGISGSTITYSSATFTSVSIPSLAASQCVQTGAGGVLTVTGAACGSGGGSATDLTPGDTDYIQNRPTLQAGATAYPDFVYVGSSFTSLGAAHIYGAVTIGNDLTGISAQGHLIFDPVTSAPILILRSGALSTSDDIAWQDSGGTDLGTLRAYPFTSGGIRPPLTAISPNGFAATYGLATSTFTAPAFNVTTTSATATGSSGFRSVYEAQVGSLTVNGSLVKVNGVMMNFPSSGTIGSYLQYNSTNTLQWMAVTASGGSSGSATDLIPGDTDYIQNRSTLQAGATFYVSSGTVAGPLSIKTLTAYDYSNLDTFSLIPRSSSFAPSANLNYTFASAGKNLNFNIFTAGSGVGRLSMYDENSSIGCGSGGFLLTTPVAGGSATESVCVSAGKLAASDLSALYGVSVATMTGAGLSTCGDATHALSWTGGLFGCQAITASGGGSGSSLAITTGTSVSYATPAISSPTSVAVFDQTKFGVSLAGSTTGFITIQYSTQVVTGAYTASTSSSAVIIADATGAALTVTLPTAVGVSGKIYTVKRVNAGSNAVTIATTSSQTIDGGLTAILTIQYTSLDLMSDGSNWQIL